MLLVESWLGNGAGVPLVDGKPSGVGGNAAGLLGADDPAAGMLGVGVGEAVEPTGTTTGAVVAGNVVAPDALDDSGLRGDHHAPTPMPRPRAAKTIAWE